MRWRILAALAALGAAAWAWADGAATIRTQPLQYTGIAGAQQEPDSAVIRTKTLEYTGVAGKR